ncbi:UDP-N-acetylmuramate dehydrogenase [Loigolactobacillus backii]|uniref:UDP-N-acetylenolpyruvoylglucosamine reductase n=2 Tax=Lactobacillaceae TaxID=33958 RepID=A0A192H5L6_9LACO|nr:UDP-N-acetylmuramate dehydrogenase [Loigolactobacillus backii]ANK59946.1 UDP-N-acetylenolpyruvoylglucosamine reductase [Loigolactobacillus backii]ANK63281.1 UDP-N-acetylenolpyruvoylglucosamine reductase [Loigolactobacillus backii]ANK64880.1 UDP-N-acetylenolpyruvoylglucosamine reductase [Loigolactobacillus backii]ANK66673.1 UDP-N-acetylenolpyruvoylglucosamine reductase [Loigolactobacillus backii]ANK69713.1 UDP-N-acetylenolpyruvoylglucosamine reductase [Loigolactobacillus backii]
MLNDVLTIQQKFSKTDIKLNEPLSHYTYTKTGGPADYLAFPKTIAETTDLVNYAREQQLPLTILGNASNLIVKDGGIRGLVLILTKMHRIQVVGKEIIVQAGAKIIDTTIAAWQGGLTGLEFAAGIPGSIGGAMFMNAGAYDGEMSEVVSAMTLLLPNGQVQKFSGRELHFSYRHSLVQENQGIVLEAQFQLKKGDPVKIKARMDELNALRASKQPLEYPSCGSVFKRPTGYFTGKLIHEAGLQGKQIGGIQVSTKHAGFMVNVAHGTATNYIDLIHFVQKTVLEKSGVQLEPEVRIIGEDPESKN